MRIWSIHPKYLDAKGLVALWRETLLARHVLEGKTKGYKNHPQLDRFKNSSCPLDAINMYLIEVYNESLNRQYNFDVSKLNIVKRHLQLTVNKGQLYYEFNHLLIKLEIRNHKLYEKLKEISLIESHPIFKVVEGDIEKRERTS
jgi:hypothetical protein